MKDHLRRLLAVHTEHPRNVVREYLQARLLAGLQRTGAMTSVAFHGGTALRFLHAIPRWSEDLDFALEQHQDRFSLRDCMARVKRDLEAEAYHVRVRLSDEKTVHSAFVKFDGLLHELGLSPRADEALSVKIEVDTKPPQGATCKTTIVRRHILLHLFHHDRASLLAGKLHAVLQRPHVKGRDLFDLLWYLSDPTWPEPNLRMLHSALEQSGWTGKAVTSSNWRELVGGRVREMDWAGVARDVAPFLEGRDLDVLSRDAVLSVLGVAGKAGTSAQ